MKWNEIDGSGKAEKPRKSKRLREIARTRAETVAATPALIEEGRKWVNANSRERIGIDKPHHDGQQEHAHLPNGRAVNKDGSISHGGKPFTIKKDWADALRQLSFDIPKSRLIESEGGNVSVELNRALIEFLMELQSYLTRPQD